MARKKEEDVPAGSPAWMNTFSDLMNLLLCFFVMLFAMSTVDAEKFHKVVASFQSTFSILPAGGSSIGEGFPRESVSWSFWIHIIKKKQIPSHRKNRSRRRNCTRRFRNRRSRSQSRWRRRSRLPSRVTA